MLQIFLHNDAEADLEELWTSDPDTAAKITVFLEELQGDPELLEHLTEHNFGAYGAEDFSISKWLALWNKGMDLWRLKITCLEKKGVRYRLIYAFIPGKDEYHVLGVVHRNFNYDPNHNISKRILSAYDEL